MKLAKTIGLVCLYLFVPALLITGFRYLTAPSAQQGAVSAADALSFSSISGIVSLIILAPFFYLIYRTIKQYKASKNTRSTEITETLEGNNIDKNNFDEGKSLSYEMASTTDNEDPHPKEKAKRFCRYCGSEIDPETKKCFGCGKQYFHLPKPNKYTAIIVIAVILIVSLAGLNIYQYINNKNEQALLENQLNVANQDLSETRDLIRSWRDEYNFYHDRAVLVQDGVTNYHNYGCPRLDYTKWITIYDFLSARARGYDPCSTCRTTY